MEGSLVTFRRKRAREFRRYFNRGLDMLYFLRYVIVVHSGVAR